MSGRILEELVIQKEGHCPLKSMCSIWSSVSSHNAVAMLDGCPPLLDSTYEAPQAPRRMRRNVEKNASSLARRFRNLAGLKLLLADELAALEAAKRKAVATLDDLTEACTHRPQTLVEQVCCTSDTCAKPADSVWDPIWNQKGMLWWRRIQVDAGGCDSGGAAWIP